jgi:hypothetical protein
MYTRLYLLYTSIFLALIFTGNPRPLKVDTRPVFETDSVSVSLEWMPEEGVSYNVSVDQMADINYIQRTTVNLTVLYNIPTNVNITATSCGQNSGTAITSVELAYSNYDGMSHWGRGGGVYFLFMNVAGRCEDPLLSISDDSVIAMGYLDLAVNGTVVTFSCPPGLTLSGPDSVMCTHTGQWEPAPTAVNCSEDTDTYTSNTSKKQSQLIPVKFAAQLNCLQRFFITFYSFMVLLSELYGSCIIPCSACRRNVYSEPYACH